MTFMTLTEATEACQPEFELWIEAQQTMKKAFDALLVARNAYDEAGGLLDDSTFWDIVAGALVVASCFAPELSSKTICIAGIIGGGATITASELGRQEEIAAAEQALQAAEIQYEITASRSSELSQKYFDCLFHHLSKGT